MNLYLLVSYGYYGAEDEYFLIRANSIEEANEKVNSNAYFSPFGIFDFKDLKIIE